MAPLGNAVPMLIFVVAAALLAASVSAVDTAWVDEWVAAQKAKDAGTVSTESTTAAPQKTKTITVGAKGAEFKSIQLAINSVPENNKERTIILIADGVYK